MDQQDYKNRLNELKFKAFYYKALMIEQGIKETDPPAVFLAKLCKLPTLDSLKNEALKLLLDVSKPQIIGVNNSQQQKVIKINEFFLN